jgi:hypothetical protein
MSLAAKGSGLSRAQVADRLNAVIGIEGLRTRGKDCQVTQAILDKWLAPEALDQVIPVKLLPAYCRVTGSLEPLRVLVRMVGGEVIDEGEQILLEMARCQMAKKRAARRERLLAEQYEERVK